jgi:pimeloyl-ACP methyl ester carboxylesterase
LAALLADGSRKKAVIAKVLALFVVAVTAQSQVTWQDPSTHEVRFVTVDEGVQLEVLDWGGRGRAVVLLAGSGNTAHVFDEFAPKLTDCCHVYGFTRRGFGASSRPSSGYDDQRLADDLVRALNEAKIERPILIGHSAAGGELTTVGRQHSERLAGLVYLDAIADLEDDPPADKEWAALAAKMPPGLRPQPDCAPPDRSSFTAYRTSLACRMGFAFPESELRQQFASIDGRVGAATTIDAVMRAMGKGQAFRKDYSNIKVPVLALLEFPRFPESYRPKDEQERELIEQFVARGRAIYERWTAKLKRGAPNATIVDVPDSGHYLFITREKEVLTEIHRFLADSR